MLISCASIPIFLFLLYTSIYIHRVHLFDDVERHRVWLNMFRKLLERNIYCREWHTIRNNNYYTHIANISPFRHDIITMCMCAMHHNNSTAVIIDHYYML